MISVAIFGRGIGGDCKEREECEEKLFSGKSLTGKAYSCETRKGIRNV